MSGNTIPDIPRPRSGDPETQRFYDAVRQAFAAVQRTDSQALVTYEELGRRLLPLYDQYKNISYKVGGGKACDGASVPAAVSNIQTSGAFGVITLTWDAAVYRGHGSTEVWASKGTDVAAAELVGTSETTYLEHAVPAIEFTTENEYEVSRNYWLRHVSACDKGYGPWSDMVTASTPASPTLIGELMAKNADAMVQSLGLDKTLEDVDRRIVDARNHANSLVTSAETRLWGTINSQGSDINSIKLVNNDQADLISGLRTDFNGASNRITNVEQTTATQATKITSLTADLNGAKSNITSLQNTTANQATTLNTLSTTVDSHSSSISSFNQTTSSLASQITDVRTTANGAYSAVQTKAEASVVNGIGSRYTVMTDSNGYVQGVGMLNTGNPETSGIAFNVSNFYVTNTVDGTKYHPFMIKDDTVYADKLLVRKGNIEKLNVMDIAMSGIIESANYVAGSSGWKIDNAGNAEFNAINVRVPISNVTGQITKGDSQSVSGNMPYNVSGSGNVVTTATLYVVPPVSGKQFSILVFASIRGWNWGGDLKDLAVIIKLNGSQIAASSAAAPYGTSVTVMTLQTGRTGTDVIAFDVGGHNTQGTYDGNVGFVVFPE